MKNIFLFLILFNSLFSESYQIDNNLLNTITKNQKIDINNCSYEALKTLNLNKDKINSITSYLVYNEIKNIYDLFEVENITIEDIKIIRKQVVINRKKVKRDYSYLEDQLRSSFGSGDISGEVQKKYFYSKKNINNMNYDELSSLPNLSPIDVVAVLKQKKRGEIKGTFELKNSPGISYYGYKNLTKYIGFDNSNDDFIFRFKTRVTSFKNISLDSDGATISYRGRDNIPQKSLKIYMEKKIDNKFGLNIGLLRYNNEGDPEGAYTIKKFISFEDILLSDNNFKIDNLIIGNFIASFGQGLIFESTDFFRARKTGFKYSKRINGIFYDHSDSYQYTLNGLAFQASNDFFRLSFFASKDKRDAILNQDGSFTSFITLSPRYGYGLYNDPENMHGNMIDAVTEITWGGNLRYSPIIGTNIGITMYESLYDRVLDPQIIESVVGGVDDTEFEFNSLTDYDEYSGDAFYLKYPQSNSCDPEIAAMYESQATSSIWEDTKSARQIQGIEFNTVINNLSFQFEYGEINENNNEILKFNHNKPSALILNTYFQFDNLNILILHRDYDLDYDNPYQRSFSQYQRYKSSIFEDDYWLDDPLFSLLFSANPQPQSEKGTYIEFRYQFHERFITSIEWDSWIRKADNAKYYRLVSKLEWRPLFNYRVYLRHKLQARGDFDIFHPSPYNINEIRVTNKIRLSNFNSMEITYSYNYARFSPRPRLVDSANPYISSMNVGDIGSPDETIGFSFLHNHSEKFEIGSGFYYINGFMWTIFENLFTTYETSSGLFVKWIALDFKPSPLFAIKFNLRHTSSSPSTTVVNGSTIDGQYIDNPFLHSQGFNYVLEINYAL